jgi:predicted lipid-binding transport protein (Tim44 family)
MSGNILYAILGIAVGVIGAAMRFFSNRRSKPINTQKGQSRENLRIKIFEVTSPWD